MAFLAAFFLADCSDLEPVRMDLVTRVWMLKEIAILRPMKADILVVLDNSVSMAEEQGIFLENLSEMIKNLIDPPEWGDPFAGDDDFLYHAPLEDLHLGVISTDLGTAGHVVTSCHNPREGDDGVLLNAGNYYLPGCRQEYPNFLDFDEFDILYGPCRSPEERELDRQVYAEQMAADFRCMASLGTEGCGFEQPLEAALRALTIHAEPGGANEGFLRDDALLFILFVTDEDDCSVNLSDPGNAQIFDVTEPSGEPVNLRCYNYAHMLHPVERYVEAFRALKDHPDLVNIGIITGVPPYAPDCEGRIRPDSTCLDHEKMQVAVDPSNRYLPRPSCESLDNETSAFPPRRLVEFAMKMAEKNDRNIVIQSICTSNYLPVLSPITEKFCSYMHPHYRMRSLPQKKDSSDQRGCSCLSPCRIFITLPDDRACEHPTVPFFYRDSNGDGMINEQDASIVEYDGKIHTLCEIPQLPTLMGGCPCCLDPEATDCTCDIECNDVEAELFQPSCEEGWWYLPHFDNESYGEAVTEPKLVIPLRLIPRGSGVSITCDSEVCPSIRLCGPDPWHPTRCCNVNEFCWNGKCLLRPDICGEYGDDLWCPAPDLPYGGTCCLDHDFDGHLDVKDLNGDGLWDMSSHYCDGNTCVPRH